MVRFFTILRQPHLDVVLPTCEDKSTFFLFVILILFSANDVRAACYTGDSGWIVCQDSPSSHEVRPHLVIS